MVSKLRRGVYAGVSKTSRNSCEMKASCTGNYNANAAVSQHGHSYSITTIFFAHNTRWIICRIMTGGAGGGLGRSCCHDLSLATLLARPRQSLSLFFGANFFRIFAVMTLSNLLSSQLNISCLTFFEPLMSRFLIFFSMSATELFKLSTTPFRPAADWSAMCLVKKWINVLLMA